MQRAMLLRYVDWLLPNTGNRHDRESVAPKNFQWTVRHARVIVTGVIGEVRTRLFAGAAFTMTANEYCPTGRGRYAWSNRGNLARPQEMNVDSPGEPISRR